MPIYLNRELHTLCAATLLVSLFAAYMYFLSASVVHVVMRKEMVSEIALLNSDISKLEAEYIDLQHAVSDEVALQRGFVAVSDKVFLDRSEGTFAFSSRRP